DLTSFTNVCRTFVDLYKVGLKVFDANGTKLVDMKVASGDFCAYMFTGPNGRRLCTETVTHIKVRPLEAPNAQPALAVRNCFSGLRYLMMPILYEGDILGRIIFGPFMPEEVGDLGAELQALQGEFDLKKAKELIDRIRRAPETTVRRILEHFAKLVDVLVFTSHKAMISSQLHIDSVTESYRQLQDKNKKLSDAPERLQEPPQLKSEVSRTVKTIAVDGDKIRQCVVNLLSNSVKFTPAGGQILIQAGPAERPPTQAGPFGSSGYFQIVVTDNGIGIAPEMQPKVFETFFQADSSASREYGGAGLGLSIVRSYIEAPG